MLWLRVVDGAVISLDVAAAQVLQAVDVMRVPVSEVLDLAVLVFDFAEDLFLIRAILKEAHRRIGVLAARLR